MREQATQKGPGEGRALTHVTPATHTLTRTHNAPHRLRRVREFAETEHRLRDYNKEIARFDGIKQEVEATALDLEVFGLVEVHTREFKALLRKQATALSSLILEAISRRMVRSCAQMNHEYQAMSQVFQQTPDDTEQLVALNEFSVRSIADLAKLSIRFSGRDGVVAHLMLLAKWGCVVAVALGAWRVVPNVFVLRECAHPTCGVS